MPLQIRLFLVFDNILRHLEIDGVRLPNYAIILDYEYSLIRVFTFAFLESPEAMVRLSG